MQSSKGGCIFASQETIPLETKNTKYYLFTYNYALFTFCLAIIKRIGYNKKYILRRSALKKESGQFGVKMDRNG